MTDIAASTPVHGRPTPKLDLKPSPLTAIVFVGLLMAGVGYGVHALLDDIQSVHETLAFGVFALLGVALPIALGFVKGFRDTANAVATVKFSSPETATLKSYTDGLQKGTRFIPLWVKVCVAIALGLDTMIGWKRIVVTVGERIGKTHLTYAQGAPAETVAALTIGAAELPVSTTHILSRGVAGTMAANGSGLQWPTIRSIAAAWVLTLPAAMPLTGGLYFILRMFV